MVRGYWFQVQIHPQGHVLWQLTAAKLDTHRRQAIFVGEPILTERLWPYLTYPSYRERHLEHGEILSLRVISGHVVPQHFDFTGVVDLHGVYERRQWADGSGMWYVRRVETQEQIPRQNLVTNVPWKILFRPAPLPSWMQRDSDENNALYCNGVPVEAFYG